METRETADSFADALIHPAIDYRNETLFLGFKAEYQDGERYILVYSTPEGKIGSKVFDTDIKRPEIKMGGKAYYVKNFTDRVLYLPNLVEKWSDTELQTLIAGGSKSQTRESVFKAIKEEVLRYIEIDTIHADLISAYVILTYLSPVTGTIPYLHLKAQKATGKTQTLSVLEKLCFSALATTPTSASLRDYADATRGTLLIDQADDLRNDKDTDLVSALTAGYKVGAKRTLKVKKGGKYTNATYQLFSPKVFASILPLKEDLKDRCIIVPLYKATKNYPSPEEEGITDWKELRSRLYHLVLQDHSHFLMELKAVKLEGKNKRLVGRRRELWQGIEAVFKFCGVSENIVDKARQQFVSGYTFSESTDTTLEITVAEVVYRLLGDKNGWLYLSDIRKEVWEAGGFVEEEEYMTEQKQTTKVVWAIEKLNLASAVLPKGSRGKRFTFDRRDVERVLRGMGKLTIDKEDLEDNKKVNATDNEKALVS